MDPARTALRDGDARLAAAIGRVAALDLSFERRSGRTVLARAYVEPPFSVRRAFDVGDAAHVIVVCTGPGVFDGDHLRQSIHVGAGARVVLTSQSSVQAHPSTAGRPAVVEQRYEIDDDGELHTEWDPLIPFAGAHLDQRSTIALAPTGRLLWSDAVMSGRVGRGERWQFALVAHELRVEVAGTLQYLERYRLEPRTRWRGRPEARWLAGSANYVGTMLVQHSASDAAAAEAIHHAMTAVPSVAAAADLVGPRLVVGRCAAEHGVPFAAARAAGRREALTRVFASPHLFVRSGHRTV